jgi:tetratricopeptide (TPR) repeat protein
MRHRPEPNRPWINVGCVFRAVLLLAAAGAAQMTSDPALLPPETRNIFAQAVAAQKARRNREAVEKYNEVINAYPTFAPAHFNLGLVFDADGQFEAALGQFQTVAREIPEFPAVQLFVGIENLRLERHARAETALIAATSQNSQELQGWFWLGKTRLAMGQLDAAETAGRRAFSIDSHHPGARFLLAQIDIARNAWESAREILLALIQEFPSLPGAHETLGGVYYSLAQRSMAMAEYEKELTVDPENLKATSMIGVLLVDNGDYQKAIPYLERGVAANSHIALLQHKLGQALLQNGNDKGALPHLQLAAKLDTSNAGVHFLLWKLYKQAAEPEAAAAEMEIFKRLEKNRQRSSSK